MDVVFESVIPELELVTRDAVRDIYNLPQDKQLIVYTDRITAFGYELDKPIPLRGVVLHQISLFWIQKFAHMAGFNLVTQQFKKYPDMLQPHEKILAGRSLIVQPLKQMPLRFRVIGNLYGEDYKTYKATERVGGRLLPKGIQECGRLADAMLVVEPVGDMTRIDTEDMNKWAQRMYGPQNYKTLEDICLSVFGVARNYAAARGLIIAESSFEFALFDGQPYFIGQVMTPETTSYWPLAGFKAGQPQPDYEKQPMYDWLKAEGWKENEAMPPLTKEVVNDVMRREREIFNIMTGKVAKPTND